jgi:hypothetical protein
MQCPMPTSPPASFTVTSTVLSIWYQRSPKPPHSYTVVPASSCLMASSTMTMRFVFVDLRPIARWWFHTPLAPYHFRDTSTHPEFARHDGPPRSTVHRKVGHSILPVSSPNQHVAHPQSQTPSTVTYSATTRQCCDISPTLQQNSTHVLWAFEVCRIHLYSRALVHFLQRDA